jgi:proton-translocating NADH-quinone oxidoreductase chain N
LNIYGVYQVDFVGAGGAPSGAVGNIFWFLLFVAFAVKVPLFPFHVWLPYAHVEASTTASIILAALLLKLGGYGILKFLLPVFSVNLQSLFQSAAFMICLIGVIYGSFCALRQIDMKRQIAFSSISHMSFAILGIFTYTEIGIKGGFYLMISHGLTSAALFFLVGVLSDRYHSRSVFAYSGLLAPMPLFIFFLAVISLANVGFPGTSGFVPELFVLVGIVSSSLYILLPTLLGMLLTTASGLLLVMRVAYGHLKAYSNFSFSDLTKLESFVLSTISLLIIWLGLSDPWEGLLVASAIFYSARHQAQENNLALPALATATFGGNIFDWVVVNSSSILALIVAVIPELLLFFGMFWLLIKLNNYTFNKNTAALFGLNISTAAACFIAAQLMYLAGCTNKTFAWTLLVITAVMLSYYKTYMPNKNNVLKYVVLTFGGCGAWLALNYTGRASLLKFGYTLDIFTQTSKITILVLYIIIFSLVGVYSQVKDRLTGKNLYEYTVVYWLILMFALILMSADNLIVLLIALEGVSLASYILPTLGQTRGGVIAAVKYFVFGTIGSVYLVWGIANLYAAYPSLSLAGLYGLLSTNGPVSAQISQAFGLIFIGFLIKLGAAPVHQWVSDVYSGAPLKITLLFSTFIKALLFIVFWRFAILFNTGGEVELAAGLSVLVGCYYTLKQKEVKRFLAYSSITHTGFLLLGDIISSSFYLSVYIFSVVLFFSVLFEYRLNSNLNSDVVYLTDLRYLDLRSRPLHAFFIMVSLVAMAGLPPLGGFYVKFWVFTNIIEDIIIYNDISSYVLFLIVLFASIISMFYYLRLMSYLLVGSTDLKRRWSLFGDSGATSWEGYRTFQGIQMICVLFLLSSIIWVPGLIAVLVNVSL